MRFLLRHFRVGPRARVSLVAFSVWGTAFSHGADFSKWRAYDAPNFTLFSDAAEGTARTMLMELEVFRHEFLAFTGLQPDIPQHAFLFLFAHDRDFTPLKPTYAGRPKSVAGYFLGTSVDAHIALSLAQGREQALRTIYHEYVHALYNDLGWDPPLWFNEGTAELFSTFDARRGVVNFGKAIPGHVAVLRQRRLMPFNALFNVEQDSSAYNETERSGLFYAQSWAFVHMLACNPDPAWRVRLNRFLAALHAGQRANEHTFQQVFGFGLAEMQRRLEDYVFGGRYQIAKSSFSASDVGSKIYARQPRPREIETEYEILAARVHRQPYRLRAVMDADPASPRPHEARAIAARSEGDESGFREELEAAIALGSNNRRVHWQLIEYLRDSWLVRDISPQRRVGMKLAEQLRGMITPFVAEHPRAVLAWDVWARTEAFAPQPDPASLRQIENGVMPLEDEPQTAQTLVLVAFGWKRLGEIGEAQRVVDIVTARPTFTEAIRGLMTNLLAGPSAPAPVTK